MSEEGQSKSNHGFVHWWPGAPAFKLTFLAYLNEKTCGVSELCAYVWY